MTAVDHEGHGPDEALAGFRAAPACTIDAGHHLALKKVVERLLALGRRHAKCHAMARPATVQPEHQARCLRRPAVTVRVDAEAAVQAPEAGRAHLRSEERRGGKESVSTCRSRWGPDPSKKKQKNR